MPLGHQEQRKPLGEVFSPSALITHSITSQSTRYRTVDDALRVTPGNALKPPPRQRAFHVGFDAVSSNIVGRGKSSLATV